MLPFDSTLMERILELEKTKGYLIEGKLWGICIGLNLMKFA